MKINLKSFLKSGFVSALVIMLVGSGLIPLVGNEMNMVLQDRLLPPLSSLSAVYFSFISILFGFSVLFFYIIFRSFFKTKLKAVFTVSIVFWFFTYFISNITSAVYGFMPFTFVAIGISWGLLELFFGCLVGSKLYKD